MTAATEIPSVRLANDIGVQFHHLPKADAVAAIAAHLRMFWDPRMRAQLLAHVAAGGEDVDDLVVAACDLLRSE